MKRTISYIPEIKGCYGLRVWVPTADKELTDFIKLICLWGGPVDHRDTARGDEALYELPMRTEENKLWKLACNRLDIEFVK
jgi:hypothetical protein